MPNNALHRHAGCHRDHRHVADETTIGCVKGQLTGLVGRAVLCRVDHVMGSKTLGGMHMRMGRKRRHDGDDENGQKGDSPSE